MPQGKGTYGSKVGRPSKKKKNGSKKNAASSISNADLRMMRGASSKSNKDVKMASRMKKKKK
jgi:hypothetical protein